jgi:hypothetical protein
MRRSIRLVLVMALTSVAACSSDDSPTDVPGSGEIVTETRSVANFSGVTLLGPGVLKIQRTGTETLTITTDKNLMQFISSDVANGELVIGIAEAVNALPTIPILYELTVAGLNAVTVVGNSSVEADDINTDSLSVFLSGNGRIVLGGAVQYQGVDLRATGTYEARELQSAVSRVAVRGTAFAIVNVSDTLFAQVFECGRVDYFGSPAIFQDVSSCGSVKRR